MNQVFSTLYAISSVGFIVACLPQIIQILRTKTVEGISTQTYDMWLCLQIFAMPYTFESGNPLWIGANFMWLLYYSAMVVLIQHYRYPHYVRVIVDKLVRVLRFVAVPMHTRN